MLTKSLRSCLTAVALSLAAIVPVHADSWKLLGEQRVGQRPDADSFHVGREAGRYDELKFRVLGSQVAVADVKVVYVNGTSEHLSVHEHMSPGTATKAYDLKGNHRTIDRIDILYQNEGSGQHARMQIYGLKHEPSPIPFPAPVPSPGYNWENLGTRPVSLTVDHDTIMVGANRGKFRAIKLHVHDKSINVYNLRITFKNGEVQEFPIEGTIHAGMTTAPFSLSGTYRTVERIDMVYRTEGASGGIARVTTYGLH